MLSDSALDGGAEGNGKKTNEKVDEVEMSDGMYCMICNKLMIPSKEQICSECKEALRRAGYVKTVRCKDCKYYDYFNGCMSWHDVNSNNDNWYCADGERRTDDD